MTRRVLLPYRPDGTDLFGTGAGLLSTFAGRLAVPCPALLALKAMAVGSAAAFLGVTYATANALTAALERAGILREATAGAGNRVFLYQPYLDVVSGR